MNKEAEHQRKPGWDRGRIKQAGNRWTGPGARQLLDGSGLQAEVQ